MEMEFKDIPDSRPYGFWLSPGLQLFVVPFEGHAKIASELVFENKKLKTQYDKAMTDADTELSLITPMQFLESIGFIRIVFDSKLRANGKLYYVGQTSAKQKQLINDLGMFYETAPVEDNHENRTKRLMGYYESVSFAELPESGFYGFWVLPHGDVEVVHNYGTHAIIAKHIVLNNSKLEERFAAYMGLGESIEKIKTIGAQTFFEWFYTVYGAIRAVKENRMLRFSYAKPMTNSSKKTIKDLADFYQLEAEGESDIIQ